MIAGMDEEVFSRATPIANSYWVIPGRLLAGEHPSGVTRADTLARLECLLEAGITSFLDLTEQHELPSYEPLLHEIAAASPLYYRRLPITDHSVPESPGRMTEILDYLDAELSAGRNVYVHCRAGIGRTGTTVACHLIRSGLDNEQALAQLQRLWRQCARSRSWPSVPETDEQIEFVKGWRDRALSGNDAPALAARVEGAFVGAAIGEALGRIAATSAPSQSPEAIATCAREARTLVPGADTAMTCAVAESLLAIGRHDPADQLERYLAWSRSHPSLVPPELKRALAVWQWSRKAHAGSHDPKNLDPHTLPRTLAVAGYYHGDASTALELAREVSRTTLQSPVILDLCQLWCGTWIDAFNAVPQRVLVNYGGPATAHARKRALKPQVQALIARSVTYTEYATDALVATQLAMEAMREADTFEQAVLGCLARTRATPSAGSLVGALAGACFGIDAIPSEWRAKLDGEITLRALARKLAY